MTSPHVQISNIGSLRIITFNNPKKNNALDAKAYRATTYALNDAAVDDTVTVVALTGAGSYYSSGNDISALLEADDPQTSRDLGLGIVRDMVQAFVRFPKLLVAVVNGPCIGIAATTVPLCDVVYASESAYFYTPFTALGICAEATSSYTFPRILGTSKASEMLLLNHKLGAREALQFNFVSEVFAAEELETKIWPRIRKFAKLPLGSIRTSKRLLRRFDEHAMLSALEFETAELRQRYDSEEAQNAIVNFMTRKTSSKL